jgi:uncharacterized protein YoaH (UPF0181 family)
VAKAYQDATVAKWLRKDRDDSRQTVSRLHIERDRARQERDSTQQRVSSLQSDLKREKVQKREAEGISIGLALDLGQSQKELAEVKETL